MGTPTAQDFRAKRCQPCEGGVAPLSRAQAEEYLRALDGWTLSSDAAEIAKHFVMQGFAAAVAFLNAIAQVAEQDDHHPDLHLTGYRKLAVHLSTHAIRGLSLNDFILAAKIDALTRPVPGTARKMRD